MRGTAGLCVMTAFVNSLVNRENRFSENPIRILSAQMKQKYFGRLITKRCEPEKQAEVQLIESRNLFNNIINTVAAPVFIKDERHRWIMCNDSFCKLVGKPRKQILGKSDPDLVSADEAKVFWKADNETLRTGK